jgi:hypothetical protein
MNKTTKLLSCTLLVSSSLYAVEADSEDTLVRELRNQTAVTRSVKRSTDEVKNSIEEIRNRMLLSGVIDETMIETVDTILTEAKAAGDKSLQEAITHLVMASKEPTNRKDSLVKVAKNQADAIESYEKMLREARKNADSARIQAKVNELTQKLKELAEDTQEFEQKENAGEKPQEEVKEELAERQKELTDLAEQLEKDIEAVNAPEEEQTAENPEKPETTPEDKAKPEEQTAENTEKPEANAEEKAPPEPQTAENAPKPEAKPEDSISEQSEKIAENIEDGKTSEAVKGQQELLAKLEKLNDELNGTEQSAENSPEPMDNGFQQLAEELAKQIEAVSELEASGLEGDELQNSDQFNEAQANHQELQNKAAAKDPQVATELEKAGELLNEGNLEMAREAYENAQKLAEKKAAEAQPMLASGEPMPPQEGGEPTEPTEAAQPGQAPAQAPEPGTETAQAPPQPAPPGEALTDSTDPTSDLNLRGNKLEKNAIAGNKSWLDQKNQFEGQNMQKLLDQAPAEYRDLVKQYYEALSRTNR